MAWPVSLPRVRCAPIQKHSEHATKKDASSVKIRHNFFSITSYNLIIFT